MTHSRLQSCYPQKTHRRPWLDRTLATHYLPRWSPHLLNDAPASALEDFQAFTSIMTHSLAGAEGPRLEPPTRAEGIRESHSHGCPPLCWNSGSGNTSPKEYSLKSESLFSKYPWTRPFRSQPGSLRDRTPGPRVLKTYWAAPQKMDTLQGQPLTRWPPFKDYSMVLRSEPSWWDRRRHPKSDPRRRGPPSKHRNESPNFCGYQPRPDVHHPLLPLSPAPRQPSPTQP